MQVWNRSLSIAYRLAGVSCLLLLAGASAASIDADRIINQPGIVVVREKPFYTDDLVKSVRFFRIEDRTALSSPGRGYLVFSTSNGELHLAPQAIEARFFFDDLEFPETMKPSEDLERLSALKDSLDRVAKINDTVEKSLSVYLDRMADAVKRLQNDEWWESARGWVSREERSRRTAQAEKQAIDAAVGSIRQSLVDAGDVEEVDRAADSVGALDKLPATSTEVSNYKVSLSKELRAEADTRRLELEQAFIEVAQAKLKASLDGARSLREVLATADAIGNLAEVPVSTPQALAARDAHVISLSDLLGSKEREFRIRETAFDDLDAWRKALDWRGDPPTSSEPGFLASIERSEVLYKQALDVRDKLAEASENLQGFFAALPAQAILSGEGLPPPPTGPDVALQVYDEFDRGSGGTDPVSIGELEGASARLRTELARYRQLVGLSSRAQRHELWRARHSFAELLAQMTLVRGAILEEEKEYQEFLSEARRHEASRNFAAAAEAYQSAHDLAPSDDLAGRIGALKEQDLGL